MKKLTGLKVGSGVRELKGGNNLKLKIKQKYLDDILSGKKIVEYRDAHITFMSEETGKEYLFPVVAVSMSKDIKSLYPDVLEDEDTLCFVLGRK